MGSYISVSYWYSDNEKNEMPFSTSSSCYKKELPGDTVNEVDKDIEQQWYSDSFVEQEYGYESGNE
jgi:hypothetical protein